MTASARTIPGLPGFAVGLCHRLSRRFHDRDDARQDLLIVAWLHRDLPPMILTTCLHRRAIDRHRKIWGEQRYGAARPQELTGYAIRAHVRCDPDALEYHGPESEIVRMIVDGWSFREIAELRGMHPSNITRRIDRIREHLRPSPKKE